MCHAGLHGVSKEKLFRGWFLAFSAEHANRGGGCGGGAGRAGAFERRGKGRRSIGRGWVVAADTGPPAPLLLRFYWLFFFCRTCAPLARAPVVDVPNRNACHGFLEGFRAGGGGGRPDSAPRSGVREWERGETTPGPGRSPPPPRGNPEPAATRSLVRSFCAQPPSVRFRDPRSPGAAIVANGDGGSADGSFLEISMRSLRGSALEHI